MKTISILLALLNSLAAGLVVAASLPAIQILRPASSLWNATKVLAERGSHRRRNSDLGRGWSCDNQPEFDFADWTAACCAGHRLGSLDHPSCPGQRKHSQFHVLVRWKPGGAGGCLPLEPVARCRVFSRSLDKR